MPLSWFQPGILGWWWVMLCFENAHNHKFLSHSGFTPLLFPCFFAVGDLQVATKKIEVPKFVGL
jgi:hypothetical protein